MENGGNKALHEFFEKYSLNNEDIRTKYMSRAAQYYRKKIAAFANKDTDSIAILEA